MSRDLHSFVVRHALHLAAAMFVVVGLAPAATAQLAGSGSALWTSGPVCRSADVEPDLLRVDVSTTAPAVRLVFTTLDGFRVQPEVVDSGPAWAVVRADGPLRVCAVAWDLRPHEGLDLRLWSAPADGTVADPIEIDPDGTVADPIEIDPDGSRLATSADF